MMVKTLFGTPNSLLCSNVLHLSLPITRPILGMKKTSAELSTLPCSQIDTSILSHGLANLVTGGDDMHRQFRALSSTRTEQGHVAQEALIPAKEQPTTIGP